MTELHLIAVLAFLLSGAGFSIGGLARAGRRLERRIAALEAKAEIGPR
jgi:hypothetical protein